MLSYWSQYHRMMELLENSIVQIDLCIICNILGIKTFPIPCFVCSIAWSIGRIGHQYMYAEKGYVIQLNVIQECLCTGYLL